MTPRRHAPPYPWEPVTMTWREVAETVFRCTEERLHKHIPADFPRPDPILNVFARAAVLAWVDRRFGLDNSARAEQPADTTLMARLKHGQADSAIPQRARS